MNLLCEHCLVSAFVDQQKIVKPAVVDGVARDFDLSDNAASAAMTPATPAPNGDKFDLVEALQDVGDSGRPASSI